MEGGRMRKALILASAALIIAIALWLRPSATDPDTQTGPEVSNKFLSAKRTRQSSPHNFWNFFGIELRGSVANADQTATSSSLRSIKDKAVNLAQGVNTPRLTVISRAASLTMEGGNKALAEAKSQQTEMRLQETEQYHKARIVAEPQSAEARLDYARFLFRDRQDYAGAEKEVGIALTLAPNNADAQRLKEQIIYVSAATDPLEEMEQTLMSDKELESRRLSPAELIGTPEEIADSEKRWQAREKRVLEQYKVESLASSQYKPEHDEIMWLHLAWRYENDKNFEEAERQYDKLAAEYPNSPRVRNRALLCLLEQGKISEAIALSARFERDASVMGNDVTFAVIQDWLKKEANSPPELLTLHYLDLKSDLHIVWNSTDSLFY